MTIDAIPQQQEFIIRHEVLIDKGKRHVKPDIGNRMNVSRILNIRTS